MDGYRVEKKIDNLVLCSKVSTFGKVYKLCKTYRDKEGQLRPSGDLSESQLISACMMTLEHLCVNLFKRGQ